MSIDWVQRSEALTPTVRNFLNGRWVEPGGVSLDKYSPRDGRLLYQVGGSTSRQVDEAVGAARRSFEDGRWSKLPAQHRREALVRLASMIEARSEELALLECLDVGKPISDALAFDVPAAIAILRFNADAADRLCAKVYGVDQSSLAYQLRRPVGVVAGIVGWNFPLVLACQKLGPALATGNSLVLKPSEVTSLSAARIAELAIEAGVPEGVFNVIHGGPEVGLALGLHMDVDLVTFTGSSATGKRLLIAAGQSNMKRLILECGGKAPNIVFEDSPNLEGVADAIVARAFWNQGQVCTASSRLLVQEGIKRQLMPLLIKKAAELVPADPLRSDTLFGAVVSQGQMKKVLDYIESAKKEGTTIGYQSNANAPHPGGFYVSPVIFDSVLPEQKIAQEEIFGPVLSVISFRDEQEAIQIANGTIYGLSAIVWTRDMGRAHRVTHGINAGWIVVNATDKAAGAGIHISVGGHKESGLGTEGGVEGLEGYLSSTTVQCFV